MCTTIAKRARIPCTDAQQCYETFVVTAVRPLLVHSSRSEAATLGTVLVVRTSDTHQFSSHQVRQLFLAQGHVRHSRLVRLPAMGAEKSGTVTSLHTGRLKLRCSSAADRDGSSGMSKYMPDASARYCYHRTYCLRAQTDPSSI